MSMLKTTDSAPEPKAEVKFRLGTKVELDEAVRRWSIVDLKTVVDIRRTLVDRGIPGDFIGRNSFAAKVLTVVRELEGKKPNPLPKPICIVYSTVSGGGKTRAMLELEDAYYLGGNHQLEFTKNELDFALESPVSSTMLQENAMIMIARRLVMMISFKRELAPGNHHVTPTFSATLANVPMFPLSMLLHAIVGMQQRSFLAGLDEIQMLNNFKHPDQSTNPLGKYLMRALGRLQRLLWDSVVMVPLGTGIFPGFGEDNSQEDCRHISGSDSVLISAVGFETLVTHRLESTDDNIWWRRDLPLGRTEATVVTAIFWPRVRDLAAFPCTIEISTEVNWVNLMRDYVQVSFSTMPASTHLPAFEVTGVRDVKFVPEPRCAAAIASALGALHHGDTFWATAFSRLPIFNANVFENLFDYRVFEKAGFYLLSVYLMLHIEFRTASAFFPTLMVTDYTASSCIEIRPTIVDEYYPFNSQKKTHVHLSLVTAMKKIFSEPPVPVFIHTGREKAPFDFLFLFPKIGGWLCIIGDAKHSRKPDNVANDEVTNVLTGMSLFAERWNASEGIGEIVEVLPFLLSITRVATPESVNKEIQDTLLQALPGKPSAVIQLRSNTFSFRPWSPLLFLPCKADPVPEPVA